MMAFAKDVTALKEQVETFKKRLEWTEGDVSNHGRRIDSVSVSLRHLSEHMAHDMNRVQAETSKVIRWAEDTDPKLAELALRVAWLSDQLEQVVGLETYEDWKRREGIGLEPIDITDEEYTCDAPDCCATPSETKSLPAPIEVTFVVHGLREVMYSPLPETTLLYAGPDLEAARTIAQVNGRTNFDVAVLSRCANGQPVDKEVYE